MQWFSTEGIPCSHPGAEGIPECRHETSPTLKRPMLGDVATLSSLPRNAACPRLGDGPARFETPRAAGDLRCSRASQSTVPRYRAGSALQLGLAYSDKTRLAARFTAAFLSGP